MHSQPLYSPRSLNKPESICKNSSGKFANLMKTAKLRFQDSDLIVTYHVCCCVKPSRETSTLNDLSSNKREKADHKIENYKLSIKTLKGKL